MPLNEATIMEATGTELDELVAEQVFGIANDVIIGLPSYSTDITFAWRVVGEMHKRLFSVRQQFILEIQKQCVVEVKYPGHTKKHIIAWPDVLFYITPEIICRAALLALNAYVPPGTMPVSR